MEVEKPALTLEEERARTPGRGLQNLQGIEDSRNGFTQALTPLLLRASQEAKRFRLPNNSIVRIDRQNELSAKMIVMFVSI
jgi:hypothetical protein